ncbi:MAG: hypothetical protein WC781_03585 [Candidatus Pacearchaeota archaeon]|jgi:hypothetical protein
MKARTIAGISLIIIGLILYIICLYAPLGEGGGYIAIGVAFPLIIIGILLLLSIVGVIIFSIGVLISWIVAIIMPSLNKDSASGLIWLGWLVYGFLILGILYGLIEGIIKLIKFLQKKK